LALTVGAAGAQDVLLSRSELFLAEFSRFKNSPTIETDARERRRRELAEHSRLKPLLQMVPIKAISLFLVSMLLLTACSAQNPDEPENPPFDESSITNVWHKAKLRGVAFRAIGQEPGWLLEITNGTEIMLSTDYGQNINSYPYVDPIVYQEQRRTLYIITDEEIEFEILGQPCQDVMSGEEFAVSVTIRISDKELKGCGRALY